MVLRSVVVGSRNAELFGKNRHARRIIQAGTVDHGVNDGANLVTADPKALGDPRVGAPFAQELHDLLGVLF